MADIIVERQNAAKVGKEMLVQIAIFAVDGKNEEEVEKAMKINTSLLLKLVLGKVIICAFGNVLS